MGIYSMQVASEKFLFTEIKLKGIDYVLNVARLESNKLLKSLIIRVEMAVAYSLSSLMC